MHFLAPFSIPFVIPQTLLLFAPTRAHQTSLATKKHYNTAHATAFIRRVPKRPSVLPTGILGCSKKWHSRCLRRTRPRHLRISRKTRQPSPLAAASRASACRRRLLCCVVCVCSVPVRTVTMHMSAREAFDAGNGHTSSQLNCMCRTCATCDSGVDAEACGTAAASTAVEPRHVSAVACSVAAPVVERVRTTAARGGHGTVAAVARGAVNAAAGGGRGAANAAAGHACNDAVAWKLSTGRLLHAPASPSVLDAGGGLSDANAAAMSICGACVRGADRGRVSA